MLLSLPGRSGAREDATDGNDNNPQRLVKPCPGSKDLWPLSEVTSQKGEKREDQMEQI